MIGIVRSKQLENCRTFINLINVRSLKPENPRTEPVTVKPSELNQSAGHQPSFTPIPISTSTRAKRSQMDDTEKNLMNVQSFRRKNQEHEC